MKMTFDISVDEVTRILRERFNLPDNVRINIGVPEKTNENNRIESAADQYSSEVELRKLTELINNIGARDWNGYQKNECVDIFRSSLKCEYISALWALENWLYVIYWIKTWKRDPKFFGVYPNIGIR
jgi:hypothetical protein